MALSDEEAWWAVLADRPAKDANPGVLREALALRGRILKEHRAASEDFDVDAQLLALRQRLAAEHDGARDASSASPAAGTGRASGRSSFLDRLGRLRIAMLASATALAVVIGVMLRVMTPAGPELVRDGHAQRINVQVDDPAASQAGLAAELRQAGVEVTTLQQSDGTPVLQAALPAQSDERIGATLKRYGIESWRGGDLDVGFRKR